jgi:hypothetical protein
MMAGATSSLKSPTTQPKQFNRNLPSVAILIIFFIGFFFVSSLKIRVVYSTPSSSSSTTAASGKID